MPPECILHEKALNKLTEDMGIIAGQLQTLLDRDNDFLVKVINGKTEERLASELIGELYVAMKDLKKETPKNLFNNFSIFADNAFKIITLIALIVTMLKVFN